MRDANSRPTWKWVLIIALKIYAGICTLLVTACLILFLWEVAWTQTSSAELQRQTTAGQENPTRLDFTGVGLSYDLPQAAPASAGLFGRHAETSAVNGANSSDGGAVKESQASRAQTNRTSEAAEDSRR